MTRRSSASKRHPGRRSTIGERDAAAAAIAERVVAWRRQDAAEAALTSLEGKTPAEFMRGLKQRRLDMRVVGDAYRREARAADPRLTDEDLDARFTPEKVVEEYRRRTIDRLLADLRPLADRYVSADRQHEGYSVDALATADANALLERLRNAPSDAQQRRVEAAAYSYLTMPAQRVRIAPASTYSRGPTEGPVVLRPYDGRELVGVQDGRAFFLGVEGPLSWPRCDQALTPFIGPEVPPTHDDREGYDACWCHRSLRCPDAKPCRNCERLVRSDSRCQFCASPSWTAMAWAGCERQLAETTRAWDEYDRRAEKARREALHPIGRDRLGMPELGQDEPRLASAVRAPAGGAR